MHHRTGRSCPEPSPSTALGTLAWKGWLSPVSTVPGCRAARRSPTPPAAVTLRESCYDTSYNQSSRPAHVHAYGCGWRSWDRNNVES
jgi:hypothetical protein